MESGNTRSDCPTSVKQARLNKKCAIKEYFEKIKSGQNSARGLVRQLFADEAQGLSSCSR